MAHDYTNIAVLGAGNWGTTLAVILAERGFRPRLWEYRQDLAREMELRRENAVFLPGVPLSPDVCVTSDLATALDGAGACLLAVPSQTLREVCRRASPLAAGDALFISAVKGLEHGSLLRMSQVAAETLGRGKPRLAVLSGPNIAPEIAKRMPATTVVAGESPEDVLDAQRIMHSRSLRVYTSADVVGVELGGALKNVIAIASGIVDGLGLGANTKGALLTRGLAEISRLGVAMGARAETFSGLSGLGDLAATCMSRQSRNWQVGNAIGQGRRLGEVLAGMTMVAEGVSTSESAQRLAERHGVEMPITSAVHRILFEDRPPAEAISELMTREARAES